jgi:hypothetical protein
MVSLKLPLTTAHSPLSNMELIPTNLVIGDRTYRVRIQPKDEEVVRKTVKTINDKIVEFKTAFAGKDMQDYMPRSKTRPFLTR